MYNICTGFSKLYQTVYFLTNIGIICVGIFKSNDLVKKHPKCSLLEPNVSILPIVSKISFAYNPPVGKGIPTKI